MEIITFDLSIYTMNHLVLTVSNFVEKSIGLQRANKVSCLNCIKFCGKVHWSTKGYKESPVTLFFTQMFLYII